MIDEKMLELARACLREPIRGADAQTLSRALLAAVEEVERMRAVVDAVEKWRRGEHRAFCDWLATSTIVPDGAQTDERNIVLAFDRWDAEDDAALSAALDAKRATP